MHLEGGYHTLCAQRPDGSVVCSPLYAPTDPVELGGPVSQFDVAGNQVCVLFTDGGVSCVGPTSTAEFPAPPGPFRKVAAGGPCAIRTDDTLVCWGFPVNLPLP